LWDGAHDPAHNRGEETVDLYIQRQGGGISLAEWREYIAADPGLTLSETVSGIHPLTQAPLHIRTPGRAVLNSGEEILYREGRIGCEGVSENLIKKLSQIAAALNASLFDCGRRIR